MPPSSNRIPIPHVLALAAVCFLAVTPFFWKGNASGHDFEFHLFSWMDVLGQWRQGIIYPRWAALAHWGYGEARFLFYPPASWTVGAGLGAILPWKLVPGVYCWLALTMAGISMHRLAREFLPARDALFLAAFYAVNPYHLVILYWRSSFAELMASTLMPLVLGAIYRLREADLRPVLWLTLILAAVWLTNGPAALMIHYSTAGMAVLLAVCERSWRPLLRTGLAVVLGVGLASFYLLPAIYEERWVNIGEVLSFGVRPQDNFLFTKIANADHDRFNLMVSSIALAEIAVLAVAIWRSQEWRVKNRELWSLASTWGIGATLVMFPISRPLWQYLPQFRFVQLPFRWLLCLNAALAVMLTMATRRWTTRAIASTALLAAVVIAACRIQPPSWDSASTIKEMSDAMSNGTGNEGIDEYVPRGADPYELKNDAPRVSNLSGKELAAHVIAWTAEDRRFVVHTGLPERLVMRLFAYPAWRVTINNKPATTGRTEVTQQLLISVPSGRSEVRIHFGRTWDRQLGGWISVVSLNMLAAAWLLTRTGKTDTVSS